MSAPTASCDGELRVWFPDKSKLPMYLPETVVQEDEIYLVYGCTRRIGHDGKHGWCQGFDREWTYQW